MERRETVSLSFRSILLVVESTPFFTYCENINELTRLKHKEMNVRTGTRRGMWKLFKFYLKELMT